MDNEFICHAYGMCHETLTKAFEQIEQCDSRVCGLVNMLMCWVGGISRKGIETLRLTSPVLCPMLLLRLAVPGFYPLQ